MQEISRNLERIALKAVTLEVDDIPAMGQMLVALEELLQALNGSPASMPREVARGLCRYVERMILGEAGDLNLLGEGVGVLQDAWRAAETDTEYKGDCSGLLKQLQGEETTAAVAEDSRPIGEDKSKQGIQGGAGLADEDLLIMRDFAMEAMENLEKIELRLIDLAQDPRAEDTINDIFRPFHTIKGVSGFLNLTRINRLAHCTENLLDSARKGEFVIAEEITDIILESVDTLKGMIHHIQNALVAGSSDLEGATDIEPLLARIEEALRNALAAKPMRLGDILVEAGQLAPEDLEKGLAIQKQKPAEKIGKILVDEKLVQPRQVMDALASQKKSGSATDLQVKVDTLKLDNLIDLTGELVISQSMLKQNEVIRSSNDPRLYQNINQLSKIVSDLQRTAMFMRMVPIKNTFQKMIRLVRDLSRSSGKKVNLEMKGEDTEIDRNVVEELYEPLVHMVRNSMDHGLETPEERLAAGKPEYGVVCLKAYHKGSSIMIEIQDDGRGLNKARILEKALAGNLIQPNAALTDEQIFDFIFHPGFSTASQVTDVSGRGVGMDVVKKRIEKLKGQVRIRSVAGKGTTFEIALPLTLAIIEGMVVRVGRERYIIPTLTIVETVRPEKKNCHTVSGKGEMFSFRGELVPLIRLSRVFDMPGDTENPWDGLVVAVEHKGLKRGLVLDELLGKEEVVIKNLGETFSRVKGVSGGAILGDGRIGLILDMESLIELSEH
ncbi:MAG: chemotaxis protein CheA [Thermodesulfobacteriota bacterium]